MPKREAPLEKIGRKMMETCTYSYMYPKTTLGTVLFFILHVEKNSWFQNFDNNVVLEANTASFPPLTASSCKID